MLHIGFLLFPRMTQLDLTGPYEILANLPDVQMHLAARDLAPVACNHGLAIVPDTTLSEAPSLDVLCIPGGFGVDALLADDVVLDWIAKQGRQAKFVTSVCTGALALGAAGLLDGYRATTHWLSLDLLSIFGAIPVAERVVIDRNRVTGGGVTAGIDFALQIAAQIAGEPVARRIALYVEYDPKPPFAGSPRTAQPALVSGMEEAGRAAHAERQRLCEQSALRRRV